MSEQEAIAAILKAKYFKLPVTKEEVAIMEQVYNHPPKRGMDRGAQFCLYEEGKLSEEQCAECGWTGEVSLDQVPTKCPECNARLVQCNACLIRNCAKCELNQEGM